MQGTRVAALHRCGDLCPSKRHCPVFVWPPQQKGTVHAIHTKQTLFPPQLSSHLQPPAFLAFFILAAFTLDSSRWIAAPIRSNRTLASPIRAPRGLLSGACLICTGAQPPFGGFREISVVCCRTKQTSVSPKTVWKNVNVCYQEEKRKNMSPWFRSSGAECGQCAG